MRIQKGDTDSGSFMIDPSGHGTGVSSVIGAEGIGFAENVFLNVYRVTKEYGGGSTSSGMLANTIIKACENNDIVNVSWGSLGDEIGKIRPEKELWYKPAMDMGCLVVKALETLESNNLRNIQFRFVRLILVWQAWEIQEKSQGFQVSG